MDFGYFAFMEWENEISTEKEIGKDCGIAKWIVELGEIAS